MVKHFACACRIILMVALLLLMYAALWLQGGTRDMNWARDWLLAALNPDGAPYSISVGDISIRWQSITEFGDLRVTNMQFSRKGGALFAKIPEVKVSLDPIGFLPHRRSLHGIRIDGARLFLTRDTMGVVQLGAEGVDETLPLPELIGFFASDDSESDKNRGRLPFRQFALNQASLQFHDEATGAELTSNPFSFSIGRSGGDLYGGLAMPFTYQDKQGRIDAQVNTHPVNGQRVFDARLQNVPSDLVCMLASCPADTRLTGDVSGTLSLAMQRGEGFTGGKLALTMQNATITAPTLFAETLHMKQGSLTASASDHFHSVMIEQAALNMKDTKLNLRARLLKHEDGWYAKGQGACTRLNITKLYKYWPISLAPDSREWVTGQLKAGYGESGSVNFDITPEDLGPSLRDEAIDATVVARDLEVAYIPGFPNVKDANGTVHFTGKTIAIDVESGKLLSGTEVKPSKINFTNLDIPATPMTTELNLAAPAGDVATILQLKPFTFDDALNLDPAKITGSATATIKLAFDAFSEDVDDGKPKTASEVDFGDIDYDVEATLSNLAQKQLIDGRDISGLSGTVKATPKGASFDGTVKLDGGTDLAFTLTDGPNANDTAATAKGTLAKSQFADFGVPDIEQIKSGSVGIDAELMLGKDATTLRRAEIDFTPAALEVNEAGWSKPVGAPAKLTLTPGKAERSFGLTFTGKGMSIGKGTLTMKADGGVQHVSLVNVKTPTSDFSAEYADKPDGMIVTITGNTLDASAHYAGTPAPEGSAVKQAEESDEPSMLADFPALDLNLDLQTLVLVKEYPIKDVKGSLRCDTVRCMSAHFTAKTGKGDLLATIGPVDGKRQFLLTDSNTGDFLRTLDLSDRVFGGTLELKGTYDDTKSPPPFMGRLLIQNFKLRNSEILARIISIGSLSGLMNVLTGKGIDFEKFGADIGSRGGIINVTKGKTQGNALGLTIEGSINTNSSKLDLKGVVVPVSSLNSLFGKIPIIGALAGGDGEGLIAFNYSVKGPTADPSVSVNPLSALTPGFLRGIFTAGDKKVEKVPEIEGKEKFAPDASVPEKPVPWPSERTRR